MDDRIKQSKNVFDNIKLRNDDNKENCNDNLDVITLNGKTWRHILNIANKRNEDKCAICFSDIKTNDKQSVLLSCSHVFHNNCISSFEKFSIQKCPTCPICRSKYQKKII